MLSERIQKFKENHVPKHFKSEGYVKGIYVTIERSRHYTESWKQTEGEPLTIRKAKALANHFQKCSIFIRPEELLVGYLADMTGSYLPGFIACAVFSLSLLIAGALLPETGPKAKAITPLQPARPAQPALAK